jgi:sec-independent protein translocase protein TatB
MFDIGWSEMLVIAVVLIVVVGPKDLPRMLRAFGKTTAKLRSMAGDFQRQFNEALKEAELEDVKKSVDELRGLNPANEIRKQLNPFEQAAADVRAGLDTLKPASSTTESPSAPDSAAELAQPASSSEPASPVTHAAEPLKNGATAMPGVAGPEAMPAAPVMAPLNGAATAAQPAVAAVAQTGVSSSSVASAEAKSGSTDVKPAAPAKPRAAAKGKAANGKATTAKVGSKPKAPAKAAAKKPAAKTANKTKTKANAS